MKVNFSSLHNYPINNRKILACNPMNTTNQNLFKIPSRPNFISVSFTGNTNKNPKQFFSIAAETEKLLDATYKSGGVANVQHELMDELSAIGLDVREFLPYYTPKNNEGKIKIRTNPRTMKDSSDVIYDFKAVNPDYVLKNGESFVIHGAIGNEKNGFKTTYLDLIDTGIKGSTSAIGHDLKEVNIPWKLFKVDKKNIKDEQCGAKTTYILWNPQISKYESAYTPPLSGMAGSSGGSLGSSGGSLNRSAKNKNANGIKSLGFFGDRDYGIFASQSMNALEQLSNKNFNPANGELADRQAANAIITATQRSSQNLTNYYNGIKFDYRFHNPTKDYQGAFENPLDFMICTSDTNTLNKIKKNKLQFAYIKRIQKKVQKEKAKSPYKPLKEILSEYDYKKYTGIFNKYYGQFVDEAGDYNLTLLPRAMKLQNPNNFDFGHVSNNFGKEFVNPNLDIGGNVSNQYASIISKNITNGANPSSMKLDEIGKFGRDGNLLNIEAGKQNSFNPLDMVNDLKKLNDDILTDKEIETKLLEFEELIKNTDNPINTDLKNKISEILKLQDIQPKEKLKRILNEKFIDTKQKNKEWLINLIARYTETAPNKDGASGLEQLFFNENQIQSKAKVFGGLSPYKKGDILIMGWGRSDYQKGYPITLESYLQFIKDKSISKEDKLNVKYLLGIGQWDWQSKGSDWEKIKKILTEIQKEDNGAYVKNVCLVGGFFPNRLVACADYSHFTSRFEPCGITPLESYVAGTPVISTNTGGAPDFIKTIAKDGKDKATGFLTQKGFSIKPEVLGLPKNISQEKLDIERIKACAADNKNAIQEAVDIYKNHPATYTQMCTNSLMTKTGWSENGSFQANGKSAISNYLEIFGLDKELQFITGKERADAYLKPVIQVDGDNAKLTIKDLFKKLFTGKNKYITVSAAAAAVILGIVSKNIIKSKKLKKLAKNAISQKNTNIKHHTISMDNFALRNRKI